MHAGWATAPATSAQYPQPLAARTIDTNTDAIRDTTSFAYTAANRNPRISSARCTTEKLVAMIASELPAAIGSTFGAWKNHAIGTPSAADATVRSAPAPTLIQNRLVAIPEVMWSA